MVWVKLIRGKPQKYKTKSNIYFNITLSNILIRNFLIKLTSKTCLTSLIKFWVVYTMFKNSDDYC